MFFEQSREQFFKPVTTKYREQIIECLRELYRRLYTSSSADYGHALSRDDVIETFSAALVRAPVLASEEGDAEPSRFRNARDQASWVLNQLIEYGWVEKQVDEATLQSSFNFSRHGRLFTEPFIHADSASVRTRHRNTRNVRNAMNSFLLNGEAYDLLDAWEYSERILSDFTDIISELDDRKRSLVQQMGDQMLVQQATADFFDFMEKRFQPDLAIRLSADSVEKYRDEIAKQSAKIRKQPKAFKQQVELRLRALLPEMVQEGQSLLFMILDSIETRMQSASDIMLPALRRALQGFTKRADIIIRQMSYLASSSHNDIAQVCTRFAEKPTQEQDRLLSLAGELMSVPQVGLLDPASVHIHNRQARREFELNMVNEQLDDFDTDVQKELMVQQLLDQAFLVNDRQVRDYLAKNLAAGKTVRSDQLPVSSATDLLALSHVIEVGSRSSLASDLSFEVTPVEGEAATTDYFERQDVFEIRLCQPAASTQAEKDAR
ncbi:flagellar protein FliT [Reinekea thalattae]|uniref:Flagellar protein FliT n=2 Tax=Reinekea thalattae TaxID=2593301 RepID=A0A5C8ZDF7_9GAMM|nr:flagellar protein FliT [Reinekea thalattae]